MSDEVPTQQEQQKLCKVCKKNPAAPRAQFCEGCAEARRTWQLVVNNKKWKLRREKGEASHRLMYGGEPTEWARKNPAEAIKQAVKEGYDEETLDALIKGLL